MAGLCLLAARYRDDELAKPSTTHLNHGGPTDGYPVAAYSSRARLQSVLSLASSIGALLQGDLIVSPSEAVSWAMLSLSHILLCMITIVQIIVPRYGFLAVPLYFLSGRKERSEREGNDLSRPRVSQPCSKLSPSDNPVATLCGASHRRESMQWRLALLKPCRIAIQTKYRLRHGGYFRRAIFSAGRTKDPISHLTTAINYPS